MYLCHDAVSGNFYETNFVEEVMKSTKFAVLVSHDYYIVMCCIHVHIVRLFS